MERISGSGKPAAAKRLFVSGALTLGLFAGGAVFLSGCGASDAQSLYESKCGSCHSLSTVDNAAYTGDEWESVVKRMQGMSTSISDADAEKITEYLKNK